MSEETNYKKKFFYKALFIFLLYIYFKHGHTICFTLVEKNNPLAYLFYPAGLFYTLIVKIVNNTPSPAAYLNLIYESLFMIILIFSYYKILKNKINDFKTNILKYFKKYILYWVVAILLMGTTSIIVENIFGSVATNEENVIELINSSPVILFILTGLMAPVVEELVYRLTVYYMVGNHKKIYIILSGLIFGAAHVVSSATCINDIAYIIPYSIPGIALAYIYYKSDNIYVPMLFHCMHNTIGFIVQMFL